MMKSCPVYESVIKTVAKVMITFYFSMSESIYGRYEKKYIQFNFKPTEVVFFSMINESNDKVIYQASYEYGIYRIVANKIIYFPL